MFGFITFLFNSHNALIMLLLLLLASVASASCPFACECSMFGGEQRYQCRRGGRSFVIVSEVNVKVEIHCKEGNLTCEDLPTIPVSHNGYLSTLYLDSCRLPRSLACVLNRFGAHAARSLHLENCSEVTGGHLAEVEGMTALLIRDTISQKTLPFDVLSRIPTLTDIRVHNIPFQFSSSPQNTQLRWLELIYNGIEDIPRGAFGSFKNLTHLFLLRNEIVEINEGTFEGLDQLKHLDLSNNPLTSLPARALAGAPRLQELKLHLTDLQLVGRGAFIGLDMLEKIDIKAGHKKLQFEDLALSNVPTLKRVQIDSTPLASIPKNLLVGSKRIEYFVITFCGVDDLPEDIFEDQAMMKHLILNNNKINVLPEKLLWPLVDLEELNLRGNFIEVLPGVLFDGLTNLRVINLDRNRITTIPTPTFNGPKNLLKLTLRDNLLTLLDNGNENDDNDSPFANLINLEELDLSGNLIGRIYNDWRITFLHAIKRIDLSRNRIQSLMAKELEFLASNITIDLQHNNITTIEVGPDLHSDREYHGATFILDDNPLHCNCSLHTFLNFTRHSKYPKFSITHTHCARPKNLADQNIETLPLESLTCDLKDCPKNCSCLTKPETSTIELDCIKTPIGYPNPKTLNLTKTKLRCRSIESHLNLLNLPEHVTQLDLHNSSVTEVPEIPTTIVDLDLRFNNLKVIPQEVFRNNLSLHLIGNDIACDCSNKDLIKSLNKNKDMIKDYYKITCEDGSYLHKIESEHICDIWWATVIGCGLAAFGVISAVIAGVVYYNVKDIQQFIYKQGWPLPPGVYEEDVDNKTFDLLISYPDTYEKFIVSRLAPLLIKEGYSVCLRCDKWDIGDFLPSKVMDLVEKSRRTLVLLSNDYFESLAFMELRAALMNERRAKRNVVLYAVTKDLDRDLGLEELLKAKKKLRLWEASFMERLKRYLPKKRIEKKVKNQRMSNMMTAEQKMMFSSKLSLNQL